MHGDDMIFVVGDREVLDVMERHLGELSPGYRGFNSGVTALRAARTEAPGVIIVGPHVGDLDTQSFCVRLKNDPHINHCWLLALYHNDDDQNDLDSEGVGPDDYLSLHATAFEVRNRVRIGLRISRLDEYHRRLQNEIDMLRVEQQRDNDAVQNTTTHLVEIAAELQGEITRSAEKQEEYIRTAKTDLICQAAAGLRHEINNPLFAITGSVEAAFRRLDNLAGQVSADLTGLYSCLDRIQRGAVRIQQVLQSISKLLVPTTINYVSGVAMLDLRQGEQGEISDKHRET